jgi:hypothetical protein
MTDFDHTFVVRDEKILERCVSLIRGNWRGLAQSDRCMVVHLMVENAQRSLEANRLYWHLLQVISDNAWLEGRQYSRDCWHEWYRQRFLAKIEGPGGVLYPASTSRLSSKEFSEYLNRIEVHACDELGLEI